MRARGAMMIVVAGLVLAATACGGGEDEATVATRPADPTPASTTADAPATDAPTTTPTPTTERATTVAPTTVVASTVAPTTAVAETTAVPPPAGWQPVDFTPAATPVGYSGNWEGTPSPALAAGAVAPLPDGYYDARVLTPWDKANPGVLQVELRRFGFCRDLPAGSCEENPDDPNELGLDPAWSQQVAVPLDATTEVIVDGLTCERDVKRGSGADLAELLTAFDSAYSSLIAPQALAGVEDIEIAQALGGETVQGFTEDQTLCPEQYAGVLHFQHGTSPSLLLQVLLRYNADGPPSLLTPTDVAVLNGVQFIGGEPTYYFYAGFYS